MRLCHLCIAILIVVVLGGGAHARTVYLKDGAALDCESFWRQGQSVVVRVNRDTVLTFPLAEIDRRTRFPKHRERVVSSRSSHRTVSGLDGSHGNPSAVTDPPPEDVPAKGTDPVVTAPATAAPASAPPASQADTGGKAVSVPPAPEAKPSPESVANPMPASPPPVAAVPPSLPSMPASVGTGAMTGVAIVVLLVLVIVLAAQWRIYEKAGLAGWKCLIPVYNLYLLVLIAGRPWWWFLLMFIPVVSVAVYLVMMLSIAERFGKGPLFGVGLFFLPFVCFPLLAFDNSEYQGGAVAG